eukprot:GHVP01055525.1.p1 GENE.GHVP01055525.1~~GHVP01055525.1.p1  ORF type:complete len:161 (+),score=29.92 GHVP01055525.1:1204-1686(+)
MNIIAPQFFLLFVLAIKENPYVSFKSEPEKDIEYKSFSFDKFVLLGSNVRLNFRWSDPKQDHKIKIGIYSKENKKTNQIGVQENIRDDTLLRINEWEPADGFYRFIVWTDEFPTRIGNGVKGVSNEFSFISPLTESETDSKTRRKNKKKDQTPEIIGRMQ